MNDVPYCHLGSFRSRFKLALSLFADRLIDVFVVLAFGQDKCTRVFEMNWCVYWPIVPVLTCTPRGPNSVRRVPEICWAATFELP